MSEVFLVEIVCLLFDSISHYLGWIPIRMITESKVLNNKVFFLITKAIHFHCGKAGKHRRVCKVNSHPHSHQSDSHCERSLALSLPDVCHLQ